MTTRSSGPYRRAVFLIVFPCVVLSCGSDRQPAADEAPRNYPFCGEPVMDAEEEALGGNQGADLESRAEIRDWMDVLSEANVAYSRQLLEPLSDKESLLLDKITSLLLPLVHRTSLESLASIFSLGGIYSPRELEVSGLSTTHITTPPLEDYLLGGWDCVFTTVGPPDGTERYGEIIIRVSPDAVLETAWATPWSGWHFVNEVLHKDGAGMNELLEKGLPLPTDPESDASLTLPNKLQYGDNTYVGEDWGRALGLSAIRMWRNSADQADVEQRVDEMLQTESAHDFWMVFADWDPGQGVEPFAYLEAKYPAVLDVDSFEAIEVPADLLDQVEKLSQYAEYEHLIHVQ